MVILGKCIFQIDVPFSAGTSSTQVFFWFDRSLLIVVKKQQKLTYLPIQGSDIWQDGTYIQSVAKLPTKHGWSELVANREFEAIDILSQQEQVSLIGTEGNES